jgi:hypothetical protein
LNFSIKLLLELQQVCSIDVDSDYQRIVEPLMQTKLVSLTYEIELQTGEKITLPDAIANTIQEGRWLITITPLTSDSLQNHARSHNAFLNGYAPEDEGLYDD